MARWVEISSWLDGSISRQELNRRLVPSDEDLEAKGDILTSAKIVQAGSAGESDHLFPEGMPHIGKFFSRNKRIA